MRIIITDRLGANSYIAKGWKHAFESIGHEVTLWNMENTPSFDVFNRVEPDIFIGSSWQLDRATVKCIAKRPNLKVLLSLSNWGDTDKDLDPATTHIASSQEREQVGELVKVAPHVKLGMCQYHDKYVSATHNHWRDIGLEPFGLLLGADTTVFPLVPFSPAYRSDICLVSGRWAEKSKEMDKYLLNLTYPNTTLDIKIWGNGWSIPQSFGYIPDDLIKHYYASALVCPNLHEPQALKSGIDVNQRSYQTISAGGFQVSQLVRSMRDDIFMNDEVVFVESPKQFLDTILHFRENPKERLPYIKRGLHTVYKDHTFLHRVIEMLLRLGYIDEADKGVAQIGRVYTDMKKRFKEIYGEEL